ncbi:copper chaperone PCu(A)C [Blastococcus aggregatus]|nr:copper chaperone PCu(A)C [Blastococcus aggregatus]
MPGHARTSAALLAVGLSLTACGEDAPLDVPGGEVVGGAAAPDERVTEDLSVKAVLLAFPDDGLWAEGDDVPLYAAIANTGEEPARLVDVRGENFADARLIGEDGTDGPLEVAEDDNLYLEPDGPPSVVLVDVDRSLRSSQSIPVTFVFEDAGEVTIEAPVAPESPADGDFDTPQDPTPDDD